MNHPSTSVRTRSAIVVRPPVAPSIMAVASRNRRPIRSNDGRAGGSRLSTSRCVSGPSSESADRRALTSGWAINGLFAMMPGRSTEVTIGGAASCGIAGRRVYANLSVGRRVDVWPRVNSQTLTRCSAMVRTRSRAASRSVIARESLSIS